jgi:hypothetical protein
MLVSDEVAPDFTERRRQFTELDMKKNATFSDGTPFGFCKN